jgi:hypothetical protein
MFKRFCPNYIEGENGIITSPQTPIYNCIAFSVHMEFTYIWPDEDEIYAWPPFLKREPSVPVFLDFYKACGYAPCGNFNFEDAYEKIAIFGADGEVAHAARQIVRDRKWASKMGDLADIRHVDLNAIAGGEYGSPVACVARLYDGRPPKLPNLHPPLSKLVTVNGLPLKP